MLVTIQARSPIMPGRIDGWSIWHATRSGWATFSGWFAFLISQGACNSFFVSSPGFGRAMHQEGVLGVLGPHSGVPLDWPASLSYGGDMFCTVEKRTFHSSKYCIYLSFFSPYFVF